MLFGLNAPKMTLPQIIAAAFAAIGPVCVLLGVHLSLARADAVDDLRGLALGLFAADAVVRVGRAVGAGIGNRRA